MRSIQSTTVRVLVPVPCRKPSSLLGQGKLETRKAASQPREGEKKKKEKKQGKKRTKSNLNSTVPKLFTKMPTLSLNPAPRILGYPFGEPEFDMVTAVSEAQRG